MDTYGPRTTEEHLRTIRYMLIAARQLAYSIDEGATEDGLLAAVPGAADPAYLDLQDALDDGIIAVAATIRKVLTAT